MNLTDLHPKTGDPEYPSPNPKGPSYNNHTLRGSYTMNRCQGFGEYMLLPYFGPLGHKLTEIESVPSLGRTIPLWDIPP